MEKYGIRDFRIDCPDEKSWMFKLLKDKYKHNDLCSCGKKILDSYYYEDTKRFLHINSIDNFGSVLKRGIKGTYIKVSKKYLQNYVDEFVFRFNNKYLNLIHPSYSA